MKRSQRSTDTQLESFVRGISASDARSGFRKFSSHQKKQTRRHRGTTTKLSVKKISLKLIGAHISVSTLTSSIQPSFIQIMTQRLPSKMTRLLRFRAGLMATAKKEVRSSKCNYSSEIWDPGSMLTNTSRRSQHWVGKFSPGPYGSTKCHCLIATLRVR